MNFGDLHGAVERVKDQFASKRCTVLVIGAAGSTMFGQAMSFERFVRRTAGVVRTRQL